MATLSFLSNGTVDSMRYSKLLKRQYMSTSMSELTLYKKLTGSNNK